MNCTGNNECKCDACEAWNDYVKICKEGQEKKKRTKPQIDPISYRAGAMAALDALEEKAKQHREGTWGQYFLFEIKEIRRNFRETPLYSPKPKG